MKKKLIKLFLVCFIGIMSCSMVFANSNAYKEAQAEAIAQKNAAAAAAAAAGNAKGAAAQAAAEAAGKGLYGINPSFNGDLGEMNTPLQNVLGVIQVVGFVVAIVMVMYVGIKYLTAGAGQKAEVKSTMVPMLVGAAMVGLAPTLVKWIFEIFI